MNLRVLNTCGFLLLAVLSFSQFPKNMDFSDRSVAETATVQGGSTVSYYGADKKLVRGLIVPKEYVFYKNSCELLMNGIDAGWINSPNWKRKYEWKYGEDYEDGLFRTKTDDEKVLPQRFVLNNVFQPAKAHPLFQFMLNKNDSLYQPQSGSGSSRDYQVKVQTYENNPPRMTVGIHINDMLRTTSISEYKELDWKVKLKTPYKVYKRNDSIWFRQTDAMDLENNDLRFQRNSVFIIIGSVKDIDFSKGMSDGTQEYRLVAYPNKEATTLTRIDHVIIELTGHDESIKLFFDKIDWTTIDKAFKVKAK
jgi:hypothetical protein